jgi:hypothetical protein
VILFKVSSTITEHRAGGNVGIAMVAENLTLHSVSGRLSLVLMPVKEPFRWMGGESNVKNYYHWPFFQQKGVYLKF